MLKSKSLVVANLLAFSFSATAATTPVELNKPHFAIQLYNASLKDATVSFRKGVGNVDLDPVLADNTPLPSYRNTEHYGVNIEPLDPSATFNIIFKNEKECTFNIGFYAPGRPKVTMQGLGCLGGGSQIIDSGKTLLIYITDINKK